MSRNDVIEIELNPRDRRLYDRIRERVSRPASDAPLGVQDLLLLLPDLTVLLARLVRDERVPVLSKALALAGVAYVLSPVDLVPVVIFGPLGLLDDLLIVATVLSRLVNTVHPDVVRAHWSGKGQALDAIQRVLGWGEGRMMGRVKGWPFRS